MKKILIALSLFLIASCASRDQPTVEDNSPMGRVGQVLEKITLPRF